MMVEYSQQKSIKDSGFMFENVFRYLLKMNKMKINSFLKRLAWTCFLIFLYRIGTHIPVPGIEVPSSYTVQSSVDFYNRFDLLLGGAVSRMSLFSLHLIPLISAQLLFHLLMSPIGYFQALKKKGQIEVIQYWIQGIGIFFALIQSIFLTHQILITANDSEFTIHFSLLSFYMSTISFMVFGFIVLNWLAQRITQYGIGQGVPIIIFFGIASELSSRIASVLFNSSGTTQTILTISSLFCCSVSLLFIWKGEQKRDSIPMVSPGLYFNKRKPRPIYLHIPLNVLGITPFIFHSFFFSFFSFSIQKVDKAIAFDESGFFILCLQSFFFFLSCSLCYLFFLSQRIQKEWVFFLNKDKIFFSCIESYLFFYTRFLSLKKLHVNVLYLWGIHITPLICEYFHPSFSSIGLSGVTLFILVRILFSNGYQIQSDFLTHHFPFILRSHPRKKVGIT